MDGALIFTHVYVDSSRTAGTKASSHLQLEEKNSHHGAYDNNYCVYVYSGKIKGIVSRYKGCVLHESQSVTNVDVMHVQVLAV